MRPRFPYSTRWYAFGLLVTLPALSGFGQDVPDTLRASVDQTVARVSPALVRIHVVSAEYSEGREVKQEVDGSGAIISKEGYVVTNHHVAGHAARAFCTLTTKEEIEAELVGVDPLTDIALLKMKPETPREFPTASFGDSSKMQVGMNVLAMGCPMALSQSITLGIISNVELIMPEWIRIWGEMKQDGEDVGTLVKWIGHDAKIAPGNSGGPLVNLQGEIVGINEISVGLGGAIPSNLVRNVVDQIIASGKVSRAWLGATIQPRLKHGNESQGVLISGVVGGSPAEAAGMRSGDILLRINGTAVNARFAEQLPDVNLVVSSLPIGQEAEAVVLRDGAEVSVRVTPTEREQVKEKEHEVKKWGITVSNLSLVVTKEMKRSSRDGVMVTSVRPGGGAGEAKPGINERDVIVEVDGKPVKNVAEFQEITNQITEGKTEPVPVLTVYERKTERYLTVVKVGIKEMEDPGLEVKKAWLACETQVITRTVAGLLGTPDLTGFRVTRVYPGSTAEKAGLLTGDLILAVDGEKLTASAPEHYEELPTLIRQYKVGDSAKLKVLRGKEELELTVELVRAPKLAREMKEYRDNNFDITVRDICFFDKAKEQWKEEQAGVMVSAVEAGSWAALGRLSVGDLVLSVDGAPITDVAGFEAKMKEIGAAKPKSLVIRVLRGIYTLYIELEPKWNDKQ